MGNKNRHTTSRTMHTGENTQCLAKQCYFFCFCVIIVVNVYGVVWWRFFSFSFQYILYCSNSSLNCVRVVRVRVWYKTLVGMSERTTAYRGKFRYERLRLCYYIRTIRRFSSACMSDLLTTTLLLHTHTYCTNDSMCCIVAAFVFDSWSRSEFEFIYNYCVLCAICVLFILFSRNY